MELEVCRSAMHDKSRISNTTAIIYCGPRVKVDLDSKIGLKGRRKGRPGQKVGLEASFVSPAAVGRPAARAPKARSAEASNGNLI